MSKLYMTGANYISFCLREWVDSGETGRIAITRHWKCVTRQLSQCALAMMGVQM